MVSTLSWGYGVSTLILCGNNTREQAVSVLFMCTVIVQTLILILVNIRFSNCKVYIQCMMVIIVPV